MIKLKSILLSCFLAFPLFAEIDPIYELAFNKCLVGRNKMGECNPNKMPPYSLGYGFVCDYVRYKSFLEKRKTTSEVTAIQFAENEKESCLKAPCLPNYHYCMDYPCTKERNSWECWKKDGKTLSFGYYDFDKNEEFRFFPVQGAEVPKDVWHDKCSREYRRCEASLKAGKDELLLPISDNFCSAKCIGHNCHHAANDVCTCLEKQGIEKVKIVVLDSDSLPSTLPRGNIFHSMLTIPHPNLKERKNGTRCLIESQLKKENAVDLNCCFKDIDEFKKLSSTSCSLAKEGPLNQDVNLSEYKVYDSCTSFLEKRGTRQAETVPTKSLKGKSQQTDKETMPPKSYKFGIMNTDEEKAPDKLHIGGTLIKPGNSH